MTKHKPFLGIEKSLGGFLWKERFFDERIAEALAQKYNLPFVVSRILAARGVGIDDAADFLNPKIKKMMPDPFSLKDMDKAAERIVKAILQKEKIAIFGDYDVDGATSSALLKLFLDDVGGISFIQIPDRDDGYGPTLDIIDQFKKDNVGLLVLVDCGITAFESLNKAKDVGLETLVVDHHEPEAKLPPSVAVVNPKRLDEPKDNPLKVMAAVGVVFMLVVAINRELRNQGYYEKRAAPDLIKWLDIVALGTVCDVVPLVGINRAFVATGLEVMAMRKNLGITALCDYLKISESPKAFHLGYVLGPRINACGRVGDSSIGAKLLITKDEFEAQSICKKLDEYNLARREIEAKVLQEALEQVALLDLDNSSVIVVCGENWHAGVIGIIAGRLRERFNLPSFVITIDGDEAYGSARSVQGIDIGASIMSARQMGILTRGGGHIMAAGFSMDKNKIEEFKTFIDDNIHKQYQETGIIPTIEVDGALDINGAVVDVVKNLESLAPFGAGNYEPKVVIPSVKIKKSDIVGKNHIRCFVSSTVGGNLKAIAFNAVDSEIGKALIAGRGDYFHLLGSLRLDKWQGEENVQFVIEDAVKLS
ncbi:MAG: single-stranded-DNA-specific exonuclease RecJ [Alphaproteobacteria bacterium]